MMDIVFGVFKFFFSSGGANSAVPTGVIVHAEKRTSQVAGLSGYRSHQLRFSDKAMITK